MELSEIKAGMKLKLSFGIPPIWAKFKVKQYKHGLGLFCTNKRKPQRILLSKLDQGIINELEEDA